MRADVVVHGRHLYHVRIDAHGEREGERESPSLNRTGKCVGVRRHRWCREDAARTPPLCYATLVSCTYRLI